MGEVDLHFRPSVPVFDANMALGRRHDRRVLFDSVEDALREMDRAGVERALVYSTVAATDPIGGNRWLEATLADEPRLVPQLIGSPPRDDLEQFAAFMAAGRASSMRMLPALHGYPLRRWMVGEWFEWASATDVPVWLPVNFGAPRREEVLGYLDEFDPSALYDTLSGFPDLAVVLTEVQYAQAPWALGLMKALPNLHMEISRFVSTDGVAKLLRIAGESRVLFGSRFPDSPLAAQLYHLHRYGLPESTLRAICGENLERLLGGVTLTPALSRRGRGSKPVAEQSRLPQPSPVKGDGVGFVLPPLAGGS